MFAFSALESEKAVIGKAVIGNNNTYTVGRSKKGYERPSNGAMTVEKRSGSQENKDKIPEVVVPTIIEGRRLTRSTDLVDDEEKAYLEIWNDVPELTPDDKIATESLASVYAISMNGLAIINDQVLAGIGKDKDEKGARADLAVLRSNRVVTNYYCL